MSKEFIHKKLEQISVLITELEELFGLPFSEFINKFTNVRSAERNFQISNQIAGQTCVVLRTNRNNGHY